MHPSPSPPPTYKRRPPPQNSPAPAGPPVPPPGRPLPFPPPGVLLPSWAPSCPGAATAASRQLLAPTPPFLLLARPLRGGSGRCFSAYPGGRGASLRPSLSNRPCRGAIFGVGRKRRAAQRSLLRGASAIFEAGAGFTAGEGSGDKKRHLGCGQRERKRRGGEEKKPPHAQTHRTAEGKSLGSSILDKGTKLPRGGAAAILGAGKRPQSSEALSRSHNWLVHYHSPFWALPFSFVGSSFEEFLPADKIARRKG